MKRSIDKPACWSRFSSSVPCRQHAGVPARSVPYFQGMDERKVFNLSQVCLDFSTKPTGGFYT